MSARIGYQVAIDLHDGFKASTWRFSQAAALKVVSQMMEDMIPCDTITIQAHAEEEEPA